ncbi:GH36-type glycosyl hydrolase domain-containing protein [Dysgonomonas mossii]|uniref:GH36-type glycosyl hydrolase domain-containing protein n=1 Tax=Dysgonomonas mossii TaxID=163665 RepID=UPI0039961A9F
MAFAPMGETEKAWELFELLNPVNNSNDVEKAAIYKVEPYVIAADVYAADQRRGRGGWTWYTGSAAWMYRLLTETLLDINIMGDKLHLSPRLPEKWDSYKVHYRYKETVYHITFSRISDNALPYLVLDNQTQADKNILHMVNDHGEHFVEMGIK